MTYLLPLSLEWYNAAPDLDWQVEELCSGCSVRAPVRRLHTWRKGEPVGADWPLWPGWKHSALWSLRRRFYFLNLSSNHMVTHTTTTEVYLKINILFDYFVTQCVNKTVYTVAKTAVLICFSVGQVEESSSSLNSGLLPGVKPALSLVFWWETLSSSLGGFSGSAFLFQPPYYPSVKLKIQQATESDTVDPTFLSTFQESWKWFITCCFPAFSTFSYNRPHLSYVLFQLCILQNFFCCLLFDLLNFSFALLKLFHVNLKEQGTFYWSAEENIKTSASLREHVCSFNTFSWNAIVFSTLETCCIACLPGSSLVRYWTERK